MSKIKATFVFLPILVLVGWAAWISLEDRNWNETRFPIVGYDPRHILSGNYLLFRVDREKVKDKNQIPPKMRGNLRFYIPESHAKQLENILNSKSHSCEVLFREKAGRKPHIKALYIDGVDWRTFLDNAKPSDSK